MDYEGVYLKLIGKHGHPYKPLDGYYERHHIIPKSMGGTDTADNLIFLSGRAHFIAHWLLWKLHKNKEMGFAFAMMSNASYSRNHSGRYVNSAAYSAAKSAFSSSMKIDNPMFKPEIAAKLSGENHYMRDPEWQEYFSKARMGAGNPMYGKQNNALAKEISTPKGVFRTVKEGAEANGLNVSTVRRYLNNPNFLEWNYTK